MAPDIAQHTQLFEVSTLYGLATVNAAIRQGLFGDTERRVLIVSNNAANPEAAATMQDTAAFQTLARPFESVVSMNDTIFPLHPSAWMPTAEEAPLWERYFRGAWKLGDEPVHLVMESIQVSPAQSLATVFPQASIDLYADGLMTYSPTRNRIVSEIGYRIDRVLHVDLVPGLKPLLLDEYSIPTDIIAGEELRAVLKELATAAPLPEVTGPVAVLLGQYLSPLGLISAQDEEQLHVEMLDAAAARGLNTVVFKPHPTAPTALTDPLRERAEELGVQLVIYTEPVLAEFLFERLDVRLVVSCFSTGLMSAQRLYGIDAVRVGTEKLLAKLKPYANSNRIPLVIVDSILPTATEGPKRNVTELAGLMDAVGYVMQPEILSHRRSDAVAWFTEHGAAHADYFPVGRLGDLDLPGGVKTLKSRLMPTARLVARKAYAAERRLEQRFMGPIRGGTIR